MERILHIVAGMNRGGIETFLINVHENIDKKNIQYDYLLLNNNANHYENKIRELKGQIYKIKLSSRAKIYSAIKEYQKFIKKHTEHKIFHFHISSLTTITLFIILAKIHGKKIILHSHSTSIKGNRMKMIFHYIARLFINQICDIRIACSEKSAIWQYGEKMIENTIIIPNAINIERYKYNEQIALKMKKQYKLNEKIIIGHVGSFIKVKNHLFLLDVFNELLKINNNIYLLLIGDGIERVNIEKKIKKYNLNDSVSLLGYRNDNNEILQMVDILIMPSLFEGIPLALIESQAAGIKIYASDTIDKNVNITGNVRFLSLRNTAVNWAKVISESLKYQKKDQSKVVKEYGYDVIDITHQVQKIHMSLLS